jgi:hypothetical protein
VQIYALIFHIGIIGKGFKKKKGIQVQTSRANPSASLKENVSNSQV